MRTGVRLKDGVERLIDSNVYPHEVLIKLRKENEFILSMVLSSQWRQLPSEWTMEIKVAKHFKYE